MIWDEQGRAGYGLYDRALGAVYLSGLWEALEKGSIEPLRGLIDAERWPELEKRFDKAIALKHFDDDDLPAARTYMDAYVSFFKYAEGHDHEHGHGHHGHGHGGGGH